MLNVFLPDNPFSEPSYHDYGLVNRLAISTSMGNIYKTFSGYSQSFLKNSIGKYLFSTILKWSIYHQSQWITGGGTEMV